MPLGSFFLAASREAVGELAAVVPVRSPATILAGQACWTLLGSRHCCRGLVGIELDEDPARSTVDGNEEIAPCRLVRASAAGT